MRKIKLVVHDVDAFGQNLRLWQPEDPKRVRQHVTVHIGQKGKEGRDLFSFWLCTPQGFGEREPPTVLASRATLVISRYDYDLVWNWILKTVASCERESWTSSAERLCRYFDWEYDGYQPA